MLSTWNAENINHLGPSQRGGSKSFKALGDGGKKALAWESIRWRLVGVACCVCVGGGLLVHLCKCFFFSLSSGENLHSDHRQRP